MDADEMIIQCFAFRTVFKGQQNIALIRRRKKEESPCCSLGKFSEYRCNIGSEGCVDVAKDSRLVGSSCWNLGSGTVVCLIVREFSHAIRDEMMREYIKLPEGEELQTILLGFKNRWGFPQCAGAIDRSHIPIIAPPENHTDYFNHKGWHSVILQAVVDYKYCFTNINIGWPGSVHDSRVLRNSIIYEKAEEESSFQK
ncbi:Protein ANTAGONIST OF LIKE HETEROCHROMATIN PROTEIN 1 [Anabarilius grahami]|uniref:Protein ANTAGONIST OF LIKE HETEROCHROMATIN PROTEIN 1 n=1 Tax=Anabarilius grahami TaxID=495550 RepID=A0A3N0XQP3_ANAGA|nr:Protein ANTAGONIST OF LIKE HETEROCHROMATIN PROTEIN 1 [Anabarilius grahami]